MTPLRITVLGSGTSSGIPTIGCSCEVCLSTDPRDKRLRPSVLLQYDDRNVMIDTGPDFRTQVLRHKIQHLDAVLYTHAHADHILGLDDVRPFNYFQKSTIPLYATDETFAIIRRVFAYAVNNCERGDDDFARGQGSDQTDANLPVEPQRPDQGFHDVPDGSCKALGDGRRLTAIER